MVNQSLLIPYVYNATSGIVVDVGERIEIVAITDGMYYVQQSDCDYLSLLTIISLHNLIYI